MPASINEMLAKFRPSVQQVRAYRENYGCGLVEARRALTKQMMLTELHRVADDLNTPTERLLHALVYALILGELG